MRKRKTNNVKSFEKPVFVLGIPEWSGGKRSEPKRNGGIPKTSKNSATSGDHVKLDPEVVEIPPIVCELPKAVWINPSGPAVCSRSSDPLQAGEDEFMDSKIVRDRLV